MKKRLAALCIALAGLLAGCADTKEIDDTAFILSLGVDIGEEKAYEITFQLPILANEDSPAFQTITCQAEGLTDAISLLNANTPYRVDTSHLNFLVIGRALAERGVSEVIEPLMRMPQVREGAMMIVAEDTANTFLHALQSDEQTNLMQLQQSVITEAGSSGLFPFCSLDEFYDTLCEQRNSAVVALGAKREQNTNDKDIFSDLAGHTGLESPLEGEFLGAAVFDGDRMVGTLTGEQTRIWCMAAGKFKSGNINLNNPFEKGLITMHIKSTGAPKVKVDLSDSQPCAQISVPLEGYLVSYAGGEDYEEKIKQGEIQPLVQNYLQTQMDKLCQTFADWGVDGFGVGAHAAAQFKTQQAWQNFNWPEKRKHMQAQLSPTLKISLYRAELGEER